MEEEHEVYGGDIPEEVEGDMEGDLDAHPDDLNLKVDDVGADDVASKVSSLARSHARSVCAIPKLAPLLCLATFALCNANATRRVPMITSFVRSLVRSFVGSCCVRGD